MTRSTHRLQPSKASQSKNPSKDDSKFPATQIGDKGCSMGLAPACPIHTYLRGKHRSKYTDQWIPEGSSPFTRGALRTMSPCTVLVRLIPAYARSTRHRCLGLSIVGAHPRLRGEHSLPMTARMFSLGSSPLTRGALTFSLRIRRLGGSSPLTRGAPVI